MVVSNLLLTLSVPLPFALSVPMLTEPWEPLRKYYYTSAPRGRARIIIAGKASIYIGHLSMYRLKACMSENPDKVKKIEI